VALGQEPISEVDALCPTAGMAKPECHQRGSAAARTSPSPVARSCRFASKQIDEVENGARGASDDQGFSFEKDAIAAAALSERIQPPREITRERTDFLLQSGRKRAVLLKLPLQAWRKITALRKSRWKAFWCLCPSPLLDGASIRVAEHDRDRGGLTRVSCPFPFTFSFSLTGEDDRECEHAQKDKPHFHIAVNILLLAFRN
jgi:hypothetical protein